MQMNWITRFNRGEKTSILGRNYRITGMEVKYSSTILFVKLKIPARTQFLEASRKPI